MGMVIGVFTLPLFATPNYLGVESGKENNFPIYGKVIEEKYIPAEDNKEDHKSIYKLKIKTNEKEILEINVLDSKDFKKESLDKIVNTGSIITFPRSNSVDWSFSPYVRDIYDKKETYFKEGVMRGDKRADRIKVLDFD